MPRSKNSSERLFAAVNRERSALIGLAAVIAACPSVAAARDKPGAPSLTIEPIVARSLLSPVDEVRRPLTDYRLSPALDSASGQRARLSVELGKATVYAITGRLIREPAASGPLEPADARLLGKRRDSGKVYGAGVSRSIHGVDLSATYQFSKATAGQTELESESRLNGLGRSHSVRATARIRFRP